MLFIDRPLEACLRTSIAQRLKIRLTILRPCKRSVTIGPRLNRCTQRSRTGFPTRSDFSTFSRIRARTLIPRFEHPELPIGSRTLPRNGKRNQFPKSISVGPFDGHRRRYIGESRSGNANSSRKPYPFRPTYWQLHLAFETPR